MLVDTLGAIIKNRYQKSLKHRRSHLAPSNPGFQLRNEDRSASQTPMSVMKATRAPSDRPPVTLVFCSLVLCALSVDPPPALATDPPSAVSGEPVQFSRDIAPILARTCYPCHGPDARRRKARLRLQDLDRKGKHRQPSMDSQGATKDASKRAANGDGANDQICQAL